MQDSCFLSCLHSCSCIAFTTANVKEISDCIESGSEHIKPAIAVMVMPLAVSQPSNRPCQTTGHDRSRHQSEQSHASGDRRSSNTFTLRKRALT